jgi:hypothetical protein
MTMRQILRAQILLGDQIKSRSRLSRIGATIFSLAALLSMTAPAMAAAINVCSKTINACGCSITTPGVYTVGQVLSLGAGSDCISIGTRNVVLNLNGNTITGPGGGSTGAGIHIKNATSIWIEGQGTAAQKSVISGWKYGIEDDGKDALIENVSANGNAKAGVFFFRAENGQLVNFTASNNAGYGVWLSSGGFNRVGSGVTSGNVLDGVFVGCIGTGKGTCASGGGNAKSNTIFGIEADNSTAAGGITVQFNSDFNQIGSCTASGNFTFDLSDRHSGASCAHNLWFADTVGTVNKACVQ